MAYERTTPRLKMPPGSRVMSLRSSASSVGTEILVALAIWRSDRPRRSRRSNVARALRRHSADGEHGNMDVVRDRREAARAQQIDASWL